MLYLLFLYMFLKMYHHLFYHNMYDYYEKYKNTNLHSTIVKQINPNCIFNNYFITNDYLKNEQQSITN